MSLIGVWGFEGQDLTRDNVIVVNDSLTYSTTVPSPGASTRSITLGFTVQAILPLATSPSGTDFWMHAQFYWNTNTNNNNGMVWGWVSGNDVAGYITREDSTSRLQIVVDGVVQATSAAAMPLDTFKRLHVHIDYQNSGSGFVRVYEDGQVGGTPIVQFSGNTNPSAYGAIDSIRLENSLQTGNLVDDLVLLDPNDGVAPTDVNDIAFTTVGIRVPNGDGTDSDWTASPGAGADYEDIDEIPVDDSDYIRATATSQASTFDFEDATFGRVLAVKLKARTIRSGTTAGSKIAFRQRLGGTTTDTSDFDCPGDGIVHHILNEDADGNPWDTLDYDSTEFGVVSKT